MIGEPRDFNIEDALFEDVDAWAYTAEQLVELAIRFGSDPVLSGGLGGLIERRSGVQSSRIGKVLASRVHELPLEASGALSISVLTVVRRYLFLMDDEAPDKDIDAWLSYAPQCLETGDPIDIRATNSRHAVECIYSLFENMTLADQVSPQRVESTAAELRKVNLNNPSFATLEMFTKVMRLRSRLDGWHRVEIHPSQEND